MAEIYRIGSDDLIDRVSTFGGINLMRASGCGDWDAQWYASDQGFEFMGDRVKIPAGKNLAPSNQYNLYTNELFSCPPGTILTFSTYIYENTLTSEKSSDKLGFYRSIFQNNGSTSGIAKYFNLNTTGFVYFTSTQITSDDQIRGICFYPRVNSTVSGYITIGRLKVEVGTKPTDWTPSPYDLVTYDSSSESLVFFQ